MSKGIRKFVIVAFANALPQLPKLGGKAFRKQILVDTAEQFDIKETAAATHYNFALKDARANNPLAVATLGRAEDKKGGRKVLHPVTVVKASSGEVVVEGLSRAKAGEVIAKAAKAKKAKLVIKEDADAVA